MAHDGVNPEDERIARAMLEDAEEAVRRKENDLFDEDVESLFEWMEGNMPSALSPENPMEAVGQLEFFKNVLRIMTRDTVDPESAVRWVESIVGYLDQSIEMLEELQNNMLSAQDGDDSGAKRVLRVASEMEGILGLLDTDAALQVAATVRTLRKQAGE